MSPATGKFRKKPVVIEAFRVTDEVLLSALIDGEELPWGLRAYGNYHRERREVYSAYLNIRTLEGLMKALPGDWVIRGVAGELYPCKPEIFAATYERVDEGADPRD